MNRVRRLGLWTQHQLRPGLSNTGVHRLGLDHSEHGAASQGARPEVSPGISVLDDRDVFCRVPEASQVSAKPSQRGQDARIRSSDQSPRSATEGK